MSPYKRFSQNHRTNNAAQCQNRTDSVCSIASVYSITHILQYNIKNTLLNNIFYYIFHYCFFLLSHGGFFLCLHGLVFRKHQKTAPIQPKTFHLNWRNYFEHPLVFNFISENYFRYDYVFVIYFVFVFTLMNFSSFNSQIKFGKKMQIDQP